MYQALEGADALMLVTEWKQFRVMQWDHVRQKMKGRLILDGRNIYDKQEVIQEGFQYLAIGLP
jgi:UDPglucose 6-dehydrogenase